MRSTAASTTNHAQNNSLNKRIFLLLAIVFLSVALIIFRLFNLQVVNHDYYEALASNQHDSEKTIMPRRGEIYLTSKVDEKPVLVATNVDMNLVFAVPKEIEDKKTMAEMLSTILEISAKDIQEKLETGNQNYVALKKQLTNEVSEKIKTLELKGIHLSPEYVRYYPEKNLASHVLGFFGFKGTERAGQYGTEGKFEKQLAGSKGVIGSETDVAGRWITTASRNLIPAVDGDDLYLTIDSSIQFKVQEVLKKRVENHGARAGSAVVINPKTGAIIAMANYPDFDPNEYSKVSDISVYTNRVLAADYEPGSIFKPITMAGALNEGKVTPETTYEDLGVVDFVDYKIKNSDNEAHGIQNMNQVLEKSLNTGMVFVEQQLGHELFKKYVSRFGFGKSTGFELSGEVPGNLGNLNKKGDVFFATASFGQGVTTTPIQMIQSYTAIANSGKMMKPYVVDKLVHPDGKVEQKEPEILDQVISEKTAATISAMLVNVVENGHGKKAGVPGYYIAGKTGTAQVPYKDRSGYDPNKNIGSFIGFGPVDNPAFLMLVRIDEPKDVRFAESTAAPAFGEIAAFILNYLQIPPSRK